MNKLVGAGVFLVLGAAAAACGSGGNAFTSGDNGGANANGGTAGGSSAGTGNGAAGAGTSAGTGNSNAGSGGSGAPLGGAAGVSGSSSGGAGASSGGAGVGGSTGGAAAGGSSGGVGGGGTGGGAACPSPTGYYTIILKSGLGCGDYDSNVPVCASLGNEVCRFAVLGKGDVSLDGSFAMKPNATFEGAKISEGSADRTGCTGSFATDTGILTIACGGTDATSGQYCSLKLTRTADACPTG